MPPLHDPSPYQYPYPPLKSNHYPPSSPYAPTTPTTATGAISTTLPSQYSTPKDAEHTHMLAGTRTPSPTPSEERALKTSVLDWKTLSKWRFWIRRQWLWYYVALIVILVITALITIYHKQIVHWLTPVTRWLHDLRFGWLVPIGVLFVISFPPLFGHEIVAILCGLVWGLWVGFGIVSAGTFIGEVGNFYAFKYCCRSRGEKLERTNITYACLAKVVRDGGFKIALIARLSAIPGHFTTVVFSTCGMGIFVFSLAAILSMPKQFITVYLGVILEQTSTGVKDKKSTIISDVVLGVTILITVLAMWYIYRRMDAVKRDVVTERRKARQAKFARAGLSPYMTTDPTSSTSAFDPYANNTTGGDDSIPLNVQAPSIHSSHDSHTTTTHNNPRYSRGEQLGMDTQYLYAPQPRKGGRLPLPNPSEDDDGIALYERPGSTGRSEGHERLVGHGGFVSSSTEDLGWGHTQPLQHAKMEDMYGIWPDSHSRSANGSEDTLRPDLGPSSSPPWQQRQPHPLEPFGPGAVPRPVSPPGYQQYQHQHQHQYQQQQPQQPQPYLPPQYQPGEPESQASDDHRSGDKLPSPIPSYHYQKRQHQQQSQYQQKLSVLPSSSSSPPQPQSQPPPLALTPSGRPGGVDANRTVTSAVEEEPYGYYGYEYGYGHGQEPTDASYRTARESSNGL